MSSRFYVLFLMKLRLLVFLLVFAGISAQASAPACRSIFDQQLLKISGHFEFKNLEFDGALSTLARSQEYKKIIETASTSSARLHGRVFLPESQGGGSLRLTRLTLTNGNLAYNHVELAALLKVNPELAHRIGFFEVAGHDNLVWVPDITQINYRLALIAKEQGFNDVIWNYAQADGVVNFETYIKMLSEGHFPFSNDRDMNLAVHDAMHAVAFASLNSTPNSRKVMKAALKRSVAVFKLYEKIKIQFPELVSSFEEHSGLLGSDGLEKTMLLTIQITGNYNYFSAANRRAEGNTSESQNKNITLSRVQNLLKLYVNGNVNFKKFYNILNKNRISASRQQDLYVLFTDTINQLEVTSETTIKKAAAELVEKFFRTNIFSNASHVQIRQQEAGTDIDTIYPERPLDMKISDGEEAMQ